MQTRERPSLGWRRRYRIASSVACYPHFPLKRLTLPAKYVILQY